MALKPDDTVCFCFHVTLRKIETFCNVEKPQHASQISECLSAGTGCGWCVPMLKHIHKRMCGQNLPWWRKEETSPDTVEAGRADESVDPQAYKAGRKAYIADGKGKPPAGAE
jgi:NAD(P)H-nitrite reductase large subunit